MRVPSITDIVREYIEKSIYTGKFKPGSKVTEAEVAAELKISRPPIREAFKLLEAEGLILRIPRRGVFVAEIGEQDALEIYTLKAELYAFSITLSFDRLTASDISRMGRLVEAMEECVRSDPPRILAYQELNASFHDVPTEAAGHKRLKHMLERLHNQIRYFSYQTLSDRDHIESSCHYHRKICEAFMCGDLGETARLSREHVLAALNDFRRKFVHASHAPAYDTNRLPALENAEA
jgi:DNA-binding GntR family transcriptional regulator